jgi:hypothetical protein
MRSAVAIAVLLLAAAPAQAAPQFKALGEGRVMADGERWALLQIEGQPARVIDDLRGRSWEVAVPSPGCNALGVAAGNVLWSCWTGPPLLQEAQTGTLRPVPGWDAYEQWFSAIALGWVGSPPFPSGLGSRWVRGTALCYHCAPQYSYMEWRTGRFVAQLDEGMRAVADLDAEGLRVKLCAPLRRAREPALGIDELAPADYDRPWLLQRADPAAPSLRLYRCGQRRPALARRCGRSCQAILGGGFLTWLDWPRIRAVRLSDGRRFRLGQPAGGLLQRTRRTIYVNAYSGAVLARAMPPR